MKRTRMWWAALTAEERSELVMLERYYNCSHEDGIVHEPITDGGLCRACLHRLNELRDTATIICAWQKGGMR